MSWFAVLLAVHVALAIALLLPSVLLPFLLRRASGSSADEPGPAIRALVALQGSGTILISVGLAATGIGMLLILGPQLLAEPWLIVALALYALNLAMAAFVSRPSLRRLIGLRQSGAADEVWRRRARRQRLIAYGMAGLIGVIGLLMSTKPQLW